MSELNPYESMIKFGRLLVGSPDVDMPSKNPELIINFVKLVEKELLFQPIDDFSHYSLQSKGIKMMIRGTTFQLRK